MREMLPGQLHGAPYTSPCLEYPLPEWAEEQELLMQAAGAGPFVSRVQDPLVCGPQVKAFTACAQKVQEAFSSST